MKIIAQIVSKPILNKHASKSICTKFQPSATFCARITNAYWTTRMSVMGTTVVTSQKQGCWQGSKWQAKNFCRAEGNLSI